MPTSCRSTPRSRVAPWFADASRRKLGQNVKYDQHVLANHGLVLRGVAHDTLLQSYVLEAHRPHDMDNLAWRHLNVKTMTYAMVAGKGAKQIDFDQVSIAVRRPTRPRIPTSWCSCIAVYPRVAADRSSSTSTTIEMPVREVLYEMERDGVMLDAALLAAQGRELGIKVMTWSSRRSSSPGSRSTSGRRSSWADPVRQMKLPTVRKSHRTAVDR